MFASSLQRSKLARGLDDVLGAGGLPVDQRWVALGEQGDLAALENEVIVLDGQAVEVLACTMRGVVANDMKEVVERRSRVVDGNDDEILTVERCTEGSSA